MAGRSVFSSFMNCIFCKIVKGEIDSAKIYEDENTFAFLDINPLTKGHCLIIPKEHFENIFDIDAKILEKIIITAKDVSEKIKKSLKADGLNLLQSNGSKAGQEIPHFHLHIIPRYKNDGVVGNWGHINPKKTNFEELKKLAKEIKN